MPSLRVAHVLCCVLAGLEVWLWEFEQRATPLPGYHGSWGRRGRVDNDHRADNSFRADNDHRADNNFCADNGHCSDNVDVVSQSEVAPGLFIGSKPAPGRHACVDVIVLAAKEYQPPADLFPGTEVIHAPIDDDPSRPMGEDEIAIAAKAAGRVARRLRRGRRVLSSCAMGLNRSSLIAAIAMHDVFGMSADEIVARIRRARGEWALSNPNFEKLLRVVIDVRATC